MARESSPPEGQEPVCWRLLTTLAVPDASHVEQCVRWYTYRWRVEQCFGSFFSGGLASAKPDLWGQNYPRSILRNVPLAFRVGSAVLCDSPYIYPTPNPAGSSKRSPLDCQAGRFPCSTRGRCSRCETPVARLPSFTRFDRNVGTSSPDNLWVMRRLTAPSVHFCTLASSLACRNGQRGALHHQS